MIPTLLLVGLLLGLGGYRHPGWMTLIIAALSVFWAVAVASADGVTAATLAGGFGIAAVNLGVTAAIGYGVRSLIDRTTRPLRRSDQSPA